jgi:hypothetical protein
VSDAAAAEAAATASATAISAAALTAASAASALTAAAGVANAVLNPKRCGRGHALLDAARNRRKHNRAQGVLAVRRDKRPRSVVIHEPRVVKATNPAGQTRRCLSTTFRRIRCAPSIVHVRNNGSVIAVGNIVPETPPAKHSGGAHARRSSAN